MPVDSNTGRETATLQYPKACYFVGVSLVVYVVIAACTIIAVHMDWIATLAQATLLRSHVMCAAFGTLGAAVAAMRRYYKTLITESTAWAAARPIPPSDWTLGWVYYYLTRPILGGVLGALAYTLSFVGIQILATPPDVEVSNEGRVLLYALAFVSGFAVSHVLDSLEAVARKVFRADSGSVGKEE